MSTILVQEKASPKKSFVLADGTLANDLQAAFADLLANVGPEVQREIVAETVGTGHRRPVAKVPAASSWRGRHWNGEKTSPWRDELVANAARLRQERSLLGAGVAGVADPKKRKLHGVATLKKERSNSR